MGDKRTTPITIECIPEAEIIGIFKCLACGHELPITVRNGFITELHPELPGTQSDKLNSSVSADIKKDVKEAERAHYNQCDKACVTMCRRALQLGLMDRGISDAPLSKMIDSAVSEKYIEQSTQSLATSIKGYGDIGAHRREQLESQEVKMVIYATVRMLNELFP